MAQGDMKVLGTKVPAKVRVAFIQAASERGIDEAALLRALVVGYLIGKKKLPNVLNQQAEEEVT